MKNYEHELQGLTDFERIAHPLNLFPTFTESEWIEWLLLGTFPEVSNVYDLCMKYGFEWQAEATARVMRNWHSKHIHNARNHKRGENLN